MIQQKGIRVHSTEEVWVYLQSYSHRNFDTASYNFMNHWWYYPFINHIGENTYRIPLIPESLYITSLVSDIPYGIGSSSLPLSFLLVAKEPNTVVYYHLHREGSDIQDIYDSLVLNTGDVGVIRALCSHSTDIRAFFSFHTNCKKVMCFLSFPRNNSDTYPEVIPFVQPLAYHWTDFLCKKSSHSTLHNTMYFNPNNTFLGDISDLTLFAHNHILDPAEYGDVTGVTVNQNSPVFLRQGILSFGLRMVLIFLVMFLFPQSDQQPLVHICILQNLDRCTGLAAQNRQLFLTDHTCPVALSIILHTGISIPPI